MSFIGLTWLRKPFRAKLSCLGSQGFQPIWTTGTEVGVVPQGNSNAVITSQLLGHWAGQPPTFSVFSNISWMNSQ